MTDLPAAIAAAREALAKRDELAHRGNRRAEERANWECAQHLAALLAALDAAQPVAWYRPSEEGYDSAFRDAATVARCDGHDWAGWVPLYLAPQAPPAAAAAVPEGMVMAQRAERLARELLADECERETHCRPATVIRSLASGTVFERAALRAIARATGETK